MEDKKVYCRRASELKSIDDLLLPERVEKFIKLINRPLPYVIEAIRYSCGCSYVLSQDQDWDLGLDFFWEVMYCEDECNDCDIQGDDAIIRPFSKEEKAKTVFCFADNGFLRHNSDFKETPILDHIVTDYINGVGLFCSWQEAGCFNEKYESYSASEGREKVSNILELLKARLTKSQFEIASFDIERVEYYGRPLFLSEEEKSLLKAARTNASVMFRREIEEIILS